MNPPNTIASDTLVEAVARAMEQAHIDHVEAHNAALAKAGLWPDHRATPTRATLAQAALTAITEAGYAIVPVEPTPRMLRDGCNGIEGEAWFPSDLESDKYLFDSDWKAEAWCCYRAMINAAPDHIMPAIQSTGPLDSEKGE